MEDKNIYSLSLNKKTKNLTHVVCVCIENVCFYIHTIHIQHKIKFNNPRKHKTINLGYPSLLRRKSATSFLMPGSPLESLYAPSEKTKSVTQLKKKNKYP